MVKNYVYKHNNFAYYIALKFVEHKRKISKIANKISHTIFVVWIGCL